MPPNRCRRCTSPAVPRRPGSGLTNQLVPQALMIAFPVIVRYEVPNSGPQRCLSEEDQTIQAGLLDAAYKSLRVGVQIGDRDGNFTDSTPVSAIIFKTQR
jgi:hypothetical protein